MSGIKNGSQGEPQPPVPKKPFNFWRMVAIAISLGWNLVLPIVAGALLGKYLDRVTGQGIVWTIGLIFAGVVLSLYNLYHILYKEF